MAPAAAAAAGRAFAGARAADRRARSSAIVRELTSEEGLAIFLVEQNARIALDVAARAYVLEVGRVAVEGPSRELRATKPSAAPTWGY